MQLPSRANLVSIFFFALVVYAVQEFDSIPTAPLHFPLIQVFRIIVKQYHVFVAHPIPRGDFRFVFARLAQNNVVIVNFGQKLLHPQPLFLLAIGRIDTSGKNVNFLLAFAYKFADIVHNFVRFEAQEIFALIHFFEALFMIIEFCQSAVHVYENHCFVVLRSFIVRTLYHMHGKMSIPQPQFVVVYPPDYYADRGGISSARYRQSNRLGTTSSTAAAFFALFLRSVFTSGDLVLTVMSKWA